MAKEWKMSPAQFRAQSVDDRAMIMAYEMFMGTCESYARHWREQKRKTNEKGTNPYHAMLGQMGIPR